jgi:hypothetical protein
MDPRIRIHTKMAWIRNTAPTLISCGQLLADFLGFSLSIDRLVASLVRRGDQSTAGGGEDSGKLVLLAAERSDEQAAGLAASLWSGRAPGKREAGAASGRAQR